MPVKENVSIDAAQSALLACAPAPECESAALPDAAGRVLAKDLHAQLDLPPFARSCYDGFALFSGDSSAAGDDCPVRLPCLRTIAAGDAPGEALKKGCAVRIMTGAPLPSGADCVINFERVREQGGAVLLSAPLRPWQNVDRAGDEIRCGDPLLSAGTVLDPSGIGLLASQGFDRVPVYKKPAAAVLSTGSELTVPGMPLSEGRIYDSNLYVLKALLEKEGLSVPCAHFAADDPDAISQNLLNLSVRSDLILTTGGASVGDKDYILRALLAAGARILFARVQMKPGSCCCGALLNRALLVCLSGNPGAALTALYRIALPAIRKMTGRADYALKEAVLPLGETFSKSCPVPRILKGHAELSKNRLVFISHDGQKNGMIRSFLGMRALAELPPSSGPTKAKTPVRVFFP